MSDKIGARAPLHAASNAKRAAFFKWGGKKPATCAVCEQWRSVIGSTRFGVGWCPLYWYILLLQAFWMRRCKVRTGTKACATAFYNEFLSAALTGKEKIISNRGS